MTALLEVRALDAHYGMIHALQGVDLSLAHGETVGLMGRNGMGKTTLLRAIMGLVPRRGGQVLVRGRDMIAQPPEAIARHGVAYVPEGRGIFASLNVMENLTMAARPPREGRRGFDLEAVFALLPRLAERRRHRGNQLSGGEQQMLTIARALLTNPDLLLVDEATEGLAPMMAETIWETLGRIRREGVGAIIVDKNLGALSGLADRVVVMSKGRLVFEAAAAALAAHPERLQRYLGV